MSLQSRSLATGAAKPEGAAPMAEILLRMEVQRGIQEDMERRTEQDRAQRASVLEDFDNRPVAFMEDDEQDAATRDQVPGLWRGTDLRNRSQEDIHAVDNKPGLWRMESLGQKPERSTGTTSVFNPDMRFGQPARSVTDNSDGIRSFGMAAPKSPQADIKIRRPPANANSTRSFSIKARPSAMDRPAEVLTLSKSPSPEPAQQPPSASHGWPDNEPEDPEITGMKLSQYLGTRESNTPIQQFTPNQVDGEVDMLVVHSEESITAIRDQIVPASPDQLPGSVMLEGESSHASTSGNQAAADPFESKDSSEMAALIPADNGPSHKPAGSAGKKSVQMSSPWAKQKWKRAIANVKTTNMFAQNVGYVERRGTVINDDFANEGKGFSFKKFSQNAAQYLSFTRLLQMADRGIPVVSPNSRKRRYWDMMILVFVIYNAVAVPLDAGFGFEKAHWLNMMEITIDLIFFVDILYNFRTAYVDSQGNLIRDGKKIASTYLKSWFAIDVLASIPFEYVALMLGINVSEQVTLLAFLKTPRLLRLGRLLRFFERMKNANVFRIVRLMATMCLIAHWIACTWHFLYNSFSSLPWIFTSFEEGPDPPASYLVAFYHAFVLMMGDNVGPQNNIEYIFCCVVLVVGACFMATVVGNMALLVSNMNVTAARHRTKMDMVSDAVRYLGMPDEIQERVQEYFDYLSTFSHPGPEGMHVLSELPTSLYEDICALLHVRAIRKVPPFKNCEEPFIMQLVVKLKASVYMPGETIFRGGDVGHEMYLISKGQVAVINNNEEIVAILKDGSYFGELALLATARRVATCTSLTHCDLNVLNSIDLQMTMRDFPYSAEMVKNWAVDRLSQMNPTAMPEPAAQGPEPPPKREPPQRSAPPPKPAMKPRAPAAERGGSMSDSGVRRSYMTSVSPLPGQAPALAAQQSSSMSSGRRASELHGTAMDFHADAMTHGEAERLEDLLHVILGRMDNLDARVAHVSNAVESSQEQGSGVLGELTKGMGGGILGDHPSSSVSQLVRRRSTQLRGVKTAFNLQRLNSNRGE
eukprot:jgi/Tetstr1/456578/TSEL_043296.t1